VVGAAQYVVMQVYICCSVDVASCWRSPVNPQAPRNITSGSQRENPQLETTGCEMGNDSADVPITACRDGKRHPLFLPDCSLGRQGIQCSNGEDIGHLDARLFKEGEGL